MPFSTSQIGPGRGPTGRPLFLPDLLKGSPHPWTCMCDKLRRVFPRRQPEVSGPSVGLTVKGQFTKNRQFTDFLRTVMTTKGWENFWTSQNISGVPRVVLLELASCRKSHACAQTSTEPLEATAATRLKTEIKLMFSCRGFRTLVPSICSSQEVLSQFHSVCFGVIQEQGPSAAIYENPLLARPSLEL